MGANSVTQDEEGNYVKTYGDEINPLGQQAKTLSLVDPLPPSSEEKVENEVKGAQDLESKYIAHHEVIDYSKEDGTVVTEEVEDATTVKEYLADADTDEAQYIGSSLGHLIADIHRFGTHGDPSLGNFMYSDGEITSIDHEFYSDNATESDIVDDIRIIESSSRCFTPEKYKAFIESFQSGYEDELSENADYNVKDTAVDGYPETGIFDESFATVDGIIRTINEESNETGQANNTWNVIRNSLK